MNIINPVKNPYTVSSFSNNSTPGGAGSLLIFQRKHVRSRVLVNGIYYNAGVNNAGNSIFTSSGNNTTEIGATSFYNTASNSGLMLLGNGSSRVAPAGISAITTVKKNGVFCESNVIVFENYYLTLGHNFYVSYLAGTALTYALTFTEELL